MERAIDNQEVDKNELERLCDTGRLIMRQAGMLDEVPADMGAKVVEHAMLSDGHQGFVTVIGLE